MHFFTRFTSEDDLDYFQKKVSRTLFHFSQNKFHRSIISHDSVRAVNASRFEATKYETMKIHRNVIGKFWPLAYLDRNLEIHYPSSIRSSVPFRPRVKSSSRALERGVIKLESAADTSSSSADRLFAYLRVYLP